MLSRDKGDQHDFDLLKTRVEEIFKPLSNTNRLKLFFLIADGPISYSEILEETGMESGSFYWHIKKMKGLIQQTFDKKYILSDLGQKALLILKDEDETIEVEEKPVVPMFLSKAMHRINQAPLWFVIQQVIILYLLLSSLYSSTQMIQFGTLVDFRTKVDFWDSFLSIIIWASSMNLMIFFVSMAYRKVKGTLDFPPKSTIVSAFLRNYVFLSPLFIPGIIFGLVLLIENSPDVVSIPIFQGVLAFLSSTMLAIFQVSFLMEQFDFEFTDSILITFLSLYPLILISSLFL